MKQQIFNLLLLAIIAVPTAYLLIPCYYKIVKQIRTKEVLYNSETLNKTLRYRLFKPQIKKGVLYPLIISLHSAAERGTDNIRQLDGIASTFISGKIQKKYPSFVFLPQCPEGTQWVNTGFTRTPFGHYQQSSIPESPEIKMIVDVIQELIAQYPIDTARIYVGGFSMGGSGTWDILSRYPHLFAAAFVMAGVSDTATAKTIKHIPIWAFNGELDDIAPPSLNKAMHDAISQNGAVCKLTIYKGVGHYCVHQAMKEPGFIEWLFEQKKR